MVMERCHSGAGAVGIGLMLAAWLLAPAGLSAQPVSKPSPAEQPRNFSSESDAAQTQDSSDQDSSTSEESASSSNPSDRTEAPSDQAQETDDPASTDSRSKPDIKETDDEELDGCDEFIGAYMKSASRKLFRALQGHDYKLRPIELQQWLDIEVSQGDSTREVSFEVLPEKEGLVVSLVDSERAYRTTFVAALTTDGPVIASFEWPGAAAVEGGEACRPTRSKIERPSAPLSKIVDIEPFKFWGLRVVWRLPSKFKESTSDVPDSSEGRGALYAVLVDVVGSK